MPDIAALLDLMARLRDPDAGCPWDLAQGFETIAPYTIEEAYEVADAIDQGDASALAAELGDLLFQVAFHTRLAEEAGLFDFNDVVEGLVDKMVRRHPHVFGGATVADAKAQTVAWERHKRAEAGEGESSGSRLDPVTRRLPALRRAAKLQGKAAEVGFDWTDAGGVMDKLHEEVAELQAALACGDDDGHVDEEMGDLLFTCVNLARHLRIDPESALRRANLKFERRFRHMEAVLAEQGRGVEQSTPEELEERWEEAKRAPPPRLGHAR